MRHRLGRDIAGATGAIVDHESLAENFFQLPADDAGSTSLGPPGVKATIKLTGWGDSCRDGIGRTAGDQRDEGEKRGDNSGHADISCATDDQL